MIRSIVATALATTAFGATPSYAKNPSCSEICPATVTLKTRRTHCIGFAKAPVFSGKVKLYKKYQGYERGYSQFGCGGWLYRNPLKYHSSYYDTGSGLAGVQCFYQATNTRIGFKVFTVERCIADR